MPFEFKESEHGKRGVLLRFKCTECGTEAEILVTPVDSPHKAYPITCECGPQTHIHIGPGLSGEALLEAIRDVTEPPLDFHQRYSQHLN